MTFPNWINGPVAETLGWTLLHSLWISALITVITILWIRYRNPERAVDRANWWLLSMVATVLINTAVFGLIWSQSGPTVIAGNEATLTTAMDGPATLESSSSTSWTAWIMDRVEHAIPWFVLIYLIGLALHVVRLLGGWVYIRRLRRTASEMVPHEWREALANVQQHLSLKKNVRIRVSDWAKAPVQIGHLKPFILVPEGLASVLTIREMEALLAHEIAHILRHDYLVNWMQSFIEVLFFYHPAVWYMSNQVRKEREHACDDLAMQVIEDPANLARALAAHESIATASPQLALGFAGQRHHLLTRIKRILNISPMNTKPAFHWPSLTLGLVAILLLIQAAIPSPDPAPTTIKAGITLPDHLATFTAGPPAPVMMNNSIPGVEMRADTGKDLDIEISYDDRPYKKAALRMRDGEIKWLKIDGKKVDPADYGQYENLIQELTSVSEPSSRGWAVVPTPPTPPAFNVPVPPVPPTPSINFQPPPAPQFTPPAPPVPPVPSMHGDSMSEAEWEQWGKAFEEQMKGFEDQMKGYEDQMKLYEEQMEQWQENMQEPLEAQWEEFGEQMEKWGEQFGKQYEQQMKEYEKQMEEYEQQMDEHEARQKNQTNELATALKKDGLIEDMDDFQFSITLKEMKVNGKVQPEQTHQKYLKLMEKLQGRPLKGDYSYSITR